MWRGYNIHRYAAETNQSIRAYTPEMYKRYGSRLRRDTFEKILEQLRAKFGNKVVYSNFRKVYSNGVIHDPEVPAVNCAILLQALWELVQFRDDPSVYQHFDETLTQIGATCLAGISIRLSMDYIALMEDTKRLQGAGSSR
jgi:hypothetical protein